MGITQDEMPWQLQMFNRSLKKNLKLGALLAQLGEFKGQNCLLVTCGDNNGALNWHFRLRGGNWTWGDIEAGQIAEMSAFLEEKVHHLEEADFPFPSDQFDCVVSIDVLEHLTDDQPFLWEVKRVLRPGGMAIVTVPNGDPGLLANRIKWRLGMTPEVYGHTRAGYSLAELRQSMQQAGFDPVGAGGYSRFFTEMIELMINYGYVFVLTRQNKGAPKGQIAPTSSGELKTHGTAYRLYGLLFPLMRLVSQLDRLLPARTDNAVIVKAVKS